MIAHVSCLRATAREMEYLLYTAQRKQVTPERSPLDCKKAKQPCTTRSVRTLRENVEHGVAEVTPPSLTKVWSQRSFISK